MILQRAMQGLDGWATSFLAHLMPMLGGLATDIGFDRMERADVCRAPRPLVDKKEL
jgi:hypothetical protein